MAEGEITKAYCRTCKHWSVLAHAIGLGNCLNWHLSEHVVTDTDGIVRTTHDFGCVLHEPGTCNQSLYTEEERIGIVVKAMKSQWLSEKCVVKE